MAVKLIIPISDTARLLEIEITKSLNGTQLITGMVHVDYYRLVIAGIDDILSRIPCWSTPRRTMVNALESFSWYSPCNEFSDAFYEALDVFVLDRLEPIIFNALPQGTFDVWEYREIGRGSILIESKGDFRVFEYYRLKDQYEPHTPLSKENNSQYSL